jgi:hypothetical protein
VSVPKRATSNIKSKINFKGKVKSVGQECPTHTNNIKSKPVWLHFPFVCSTHSHL